LLIYLNMLMLFLMDLDIFCCYFLSYSSSHSLHIFCCYFLSLILLFFFSFSVYILLLFLSYSSSHSLYIFCYFLSLILLFFFSFSVYILLLFLSYSSSHSLILQRSHYSIMNFSYITRVLLLNQLLREKLN
jgi:hypothetical protein